VNPTVDEVLGAKAYTSLRDLLHAVKRELDVVDIFRRSDDVPPIIEEAVQIHKQVGRSAAGMGVVMDRCVMMEHAARAKASL
jgi:predicted CoA-binding protein